MAKAIFRFLRGELNGFYINALHNTLNSFTEETKQFFIDFNAQQVAEGKISNETLYNLGKFASVFLPRTPISESKSAVYMTDSEIVDEEEYSERGLYNTESETFEFVHTEPDIETPDINTLATTTKRSSLVGDETVQGYISEDETDVLDDNGSVKADKISTEPPQDKAYSDFYGNQFLFLSENNISYETISPELFFELFRTIQWIRYNGSSLASLVKIIEILCPDGLIKIRGIESAPNTSVVYVRYTYNPASAELTNKEQRYSLFTYIVNMKFKQVILIED